MAIIYLDEMWVNACHTKQQAWQDSTVTSSKGDFPRGLTTGLVAPSAKGGCLILVHAGSKDTGFINNAVDFFMSKEGSNVEYHSRMNGVYFEHWFTTKLLPNIPASSVIVIDNAAYHSVTLKKVTTASTRKGDIQMWLTRRGIA